MKQIEVKDLLSVESGSTFSFSRRVFFYENHLSYFEGITESESRYLSEGKKK